MCGITGWISYADDFTAPTAARGTLDAMTKTMACRGPDAGGTWFGPHAALGHRRLAVIDIEGGAQPMRVERGGRTLLVTTYSGEVYNYRELRAELESHGHVFRTQSDTEVVLHAYLQWGEDFTERLNGMYAFALWDPRTEELLLVRDRMGIKPLYYYPLPDGVLFGSEPKAILAHPAVRPAVDAEGLAELVAFTKTPGHAAYKGMYELPPGHTARIRRGGLTLRRYWALEAREHTDDLDTTVRHVRDLLDDIVGRQLIADVPLCTLLSDGPYAHALAAHVSSHHSDIVLDAADLMAKANRDAVLTARDMPISGFGDGDVSLYLLFKAIREQSTVALSGESADEVFGGYRWFHDPAHVHADTFPWAAAGAADRFAGEHSGGRSALLDRGLLAKLDLAGYQDARYHEALAEVPRLPGETGLERRMREISHLHLTRFVQLLLDRKDRASMAVGLEVRVPFCDHRLVEYVFNTPWAMKTFDGREKSLLRAATRDVLPAKVADRVKSPYPSIQDPRYAAALRTELARVLADEDAPVRPLLDTEAAAGCLTDDAGEGFRSATELVLNLDTWLRMHDTALEL